MNQLRIRFLEEFRFIAVCLRYKRTEILPDSDEVGFLHWTLQWCGSGEKGKNVSQAFHQIIVIGITAFLFCSCSQNNSRTDDNSYVLPSDSAEYQAISDSANTNLPMGYTMHRFSTSDGLMDNNILALAQDSSGYLWICNGQGLTKYDGNSFTNLRPETEYHPMGSVGQFGGHKLMALANGEICYQIDQGIVSVSNDVFSVNRSDSFVSCYSKLYGLGGYVFQNGVVDRWCNVWYHEDCSDMLYCLYPHGGDSVAISINRERNRFPYFLDVADNFWIQDSAGLYRYNGNSFDSILLPTTTNFYSAFEDRNKNLWLVSDIDDLYCYKTTGQMELVSNSKEDGPYRGAINEDQDGNIYVAFRNGIRVYDSSLHQTSFLNINKVRRILKSKETLAFISDSSFSVLIGDDLIYDIGNNKISGFIAGGLIDRESNIWLATENGLYRFSPSSARQIKVDIANVASFFKQEELYNKRGNFWRDIHTIRLVDTKGRLWFDCFLGLVMFDPKNEETPYRQFEDINKYVLEIRKGHRDRGFGTECNGFSVVEDEENTIWIGYDGYQHSALSNLNSEDVYKGGLWRFDTNDTKRVKADCGSNRMQENFAVQTVSIGRSGDCWLTTWLGPMLLEGENMKLITAGDTLFKPPYALEEKINGDWVLISRGLISGYNSIKKQFEPLFNFNVRNISDNFLEGARVAVDGRDRIWLFVGQTLYLFDKHNMQDSISLIDLALAEPSKHSTVKFLDSDQFGNIWIATESYGLTFIDVNGENSATRFTIDHGLSGNQINSARFDKAGNLWVLNNGGIDRIIMSEIYSDTVIHVQKLASKDATSEITKLHGLAMNATGSILLDDHYNVGSDYLFNPRNIVINVNEPITQILNLSIQNDISDSSFNRTDGNIELEYDHNDISLSYVGISLTYPENVRYRSFLEGYDNTWSPPTDRNFISYTNLPEGNYTFRVIACNNDGLWNSTPATLSFTVLPPWYRTWWGYTVFIVAGVILLIGVLRLRTRKLRMEKESLEKEVSNRTAEVVKQKQIIEEKDKDRTDSINYAMRIQKTMLTSEGYLRKHLAEYFVLYKPKDIVSGDFYWAFKTDTGEMLVATADCTGHGIPGALMSMIGISKLNEIVVERKIYNPGRILDSLREEIIKALNPEDAEVEARDGMDISICAFDFDRMKLTYAGANNSIYLVRNEELTEYKADKFPIGKYAGDITPFRNNAIQLHKGDTIYAFTDGYADQFGGPKGKKFKYKQFEDLIVLVQEATMSEQKDSFESTMKNWKGKLEQVDDMLIIGIRV